MYHRASRLKVTYPLAIAGGGGRRYRRGTVHGGEVLKLLSGQHNEQFAKCLNHKKEVCFGPGGMYMS